MARQSKERSYTLRSALVVFAGIAGFGSLALGIAFYGDASDARELAAQLAELPAASPTRVGQRVVVDGVIAAGTPLLRDEFVAFRRVQRQARRDVIVETGKQPIAIDTSTGTVLVINADYRFDDRVTGWAPIERLDAAPTFTQGAITIFGFGRSSPIVAVGIVEAADGHPVLRAETIVAGPRSAVIERLHGSTERLGSAAPYLLLIAPLLLLYAFWDARRIVRE